MTVSNTCTVPDLRRYHYSPLQKRVVRDRRYQT